MREIGKWFRVKAVVILLVAFCMLVGLIHRAVLMVQRHHSVTESRRSL
jgi:hypothetical protein